jgi:hypothetical protein
MRGRHGKRVPGPPRPRATTMPEWNRRRIVRFRRPRASYRIHKKNGPHAESAESAEFSRAARRALECIHGRDSPSSAVAVSVRCFGRERSGLIERPRELQTEGGAAGCRENFFREYADREQTCAAQGSKTSTPPDARSREPSPHSNDGGERTCLRISGGLPACTAGSATLQARRPPGGPPNGTRHEDVVKGFRRRFRRP